MTMKCELRRMRVLGCEATQNSVTLHLRDDTPLDPKKVLDLVKEPRSPCTLTPDRLSRRFDGATDASQTRRRRSSSSRAAGATEERYSTVTAAGA